ncbi:MAG: hypothetical protein EOO48_03290 [Flavobacterium sp.]|nr:MAG: hypothetical protein EOO48_03290 [Flavobacterium sp.]
MFSKMQFAATLEQTAAVFGVRLQRHQCQPSSLVNAFDHAFHPVITANNPEILDCRHRWGLVPPDWNKEPEEIWNHTISAKLEYLHKRYAWQKVSMNRCLIPVTGFYEYHWNDPKGKSKTRYLMTDPENEIFALGGLYSEWQKDGIILKTFAVCTTKGNDIMEFVHNKDAAKNYSRMPVVLNIGDEKNWLDVKIPYADFAYPNHKPLIKATPDPVQPTLF